MSSFIAPFLQLLTLHFALGAPAPLRFRLSAEPSAFDWQLAHTSHETHLIVNLMEGLTEVGMDLKARPALAASWEVSADHLTYTFVLKKGGKWSDGRPVYASDFVDSWRRLIRPATHSPYAHYLDIVEGAEAIRTGRVAPTSPLGVHAVGADKLVVKLRAPAPYFPALVSFWVTFPVRADLIKKHETTWASAGKLVTTGPYRLASSTKGLYRLEANPSYSGRAPSVSKIEAIVEPNDERARKLFESGEIDFLLDATTSDLLRYKDVKAFPSVRIEQYPYLATYYLGFRVDSPPTNTREFRAALALTVDRDAVPSVLQGGQYPAVGLIPPGIEGANTSPPPSGTARDARALLAKAGMPDETSLPELELWVEKFDGAERLADFLASNFRQKIGLQVKARVATGNAEFSSGLRGERAKLFVAHWGADFPDPINFLQAFSSESGVNYTRWRSADYDEQVRMVLSARDDLARGASVRRAQNILIERESVIVPLFHRRLIAILGPRMRDFSLNPLNYIYFRDVSLRE